MPEDPEEMHPDRCGASRLRIKEMSAEVTIDEQHDLRSRKRANCKQHEPGHHKVEPNEEGHFPELHTRTSHGYDSGQHIDRCSDAADSRNEERQSPVIGAVPR